MGSKKEISIQYERNAKEKVKYINIIIYYNLNRNGLMLGRA
jgi:hypothetical protein